jgi:hypothetical protein
MSVVRAARDHAAGRARAASPPAVLLVPALVVALLALVPVSYLLVLARGDDRTAHRM